MKGARPSLDAALKRSIYRLAVDSAGHPVGFWGGAVRGFTLAYLIACPPCAAVMLCIGKPLFAIVYAITFAAAVAVWRQEMRR